MNGNHRSYHSNISFLDLFLNTLLGFVFLFLVSWLLINPVVKNKIIDAKGEFIISVDWDGKSNDDVDIWVLDPNNDAMYFGNKETKIMHLDRDDLGLLNDVIVNSDGTKTEIKVNKELVTIRGISPGEYIVNLHMYSKRDPIPIDVVVEIIKINPYRHILHRQIILSHLNEEITIARFRIDSSGNVTDLNNLPRSIVHDFKGTSNSFVR